MENLAENILQISLDTYEFADDKEVNKFIKSCKKIVRGSREYAEWVKYIKLTKNFSQCQFTKENCYELTVDIHHHPYSMESLVKIIMNHHMDKFQRVNTFDVAKEVMQLHYENYVGYVLLIKSLHEKFHNGYLQIPIELANGNWKELERKYLIPDDVIEIITNYKMITKESVPKLKWDSDYIVYDDGS